MKKLFLLTAFGALFLINSSTIRYDTRSSQFSMAVLKPDIDIDILDADVVSGSGSIRKTSLPAGEVALILLTTTDELDVFRR